MINEQKPKIRPIQGIILLFLLLAIPVGGYFVAGKTNNFSNWSFASSTFRTNNTGTKYKLGGGGVVSNIRPNYLSQSSSSQSLTTIAPTPTPLKSIAERCNDVCTSDASCGGTDMVCVQDGGTGKCRNAQCFGIADCWCYKVTGPVTCNTSCVIDTDCGTSMICVKTAGGNKCRNPQCFGMEDCLCYSTLTTPTPAGFGGLENPAPTTYVEPTPLPQTYTPPPYVPPVVYVTQPPVVYSTPTPLPTSSSILLSELLATVPTPALTPPKVAAPILTLEPFYNTKKQTNPTLVLSGTSDPNAQIDISIFPDGVVSTVQSDAIGNWQFTVPKKLPNGAKQLTVVARSQSGGQMTKTETFTVVGGAQFPFAAVVFSLILAGAVGGYLFYTNKIKKKSATAPLDQYAPPASPVPPTTLVSSSSTESTTSANYKNPVPPPAQENTKDGPISS